MAQSVDEPLGLVRLRIHSTRQGPLYTLDRNKHFVGEYVRNKNCALFPTSRKSSLLLYLTREISRSSSLLRLHILCRDLWSVKNTAALNARSERLLTNDPSAV